MNRLNQIIEDPTTYAYKLATRETESSKKIKLMDKIQTTKELLFIICLCAIVSCKDSSKTSRQDSEISLPDSTIIMEGVPADSELIDRFTPPATQMSMDSIMKSYKK